MSEPQVTGTSQPPSPGKSTGCSPAASTDHPGITHSGSTDPIGRNHNYQVVPLLRGQYTQHTLGHIQLWGLQHPLRVAIRRNRPQWAFQVTSCTEIVHAARIVWAGPRTPVVDKDFSITASILASYLAHKGP